MSVILSAAKNPRICFCSCRAFVPPKSSGCPSFASLRRVGSQYSLSHGPQPFTPPACPVCAPKEIAIRFQALIVEITSVKFTVSTSVKCARTLSYNTSRSGGGRGSDKYPGTPCAGCVVWQRAGALHGRGDGEFDAGDFYDQCLETDWELFVRSH